MEIKLIARTQIHKDTKNVNTVRSRWPGALQFLCKDTGGQLHARVPHVVQCAMIECICIILVCVCVLCVCV